MNDGRIDGRLFSKIKRLVRSAFSDGYEMGREHGRRLEIAERDLDHSIKSLVTEQDTAKEQLK